VTPTVFGVLAVALVGSALAVVLTKNLFHAVLWLALSLTATAGVFLTLDAEFLAAVQVLLYAGGVITVVVFAIVVTERLVGERLSQTTGRLPGGALAALALFVTLALLISQAPTLGSAPLADGDITREIGNLVLTRFALAFELLAVLLLASLVAALYFARPED